nr:DUF4040 domain-containing protein [Saprospiraceae bacterium]
MLTAIVVCFTTALIFAFAGKYLGQMGTYLISLLPAGLFLYFLSLQSELVSSGEILLNYSWIESLGIDLSFRLDGMAQIFALLICGIGFLVYIYAAEYLKNHRHIDRFYGYLTVFMGSMLGLVLSNNLITLFIFWELTSITSFFLIGFNHRDLLARKAALTALTLTGGGGLIMLVGFIMMGQVAGTYTISEILQSGDVFADSIYLGLIILALLVGCFTKSAQFPFHFWLPDAMRAPTPISTYLHSATMVKAGVYLLARFSPLFDGELYWNEALLLFGGITMLYGAINSIFKTDLKAILAYTTISALGIMVLMIGIGSSTAILALLLFIVVHALYKAGLFLLTGALDHLTGTREITRLSGLRTKSGILFVAGILAAVSSAGIIPALGYHGKHLIYAAAMETDLLSFLILSLIVAANLFIICAGFLVGIKPFTGRPNSGNAPLHPTSLLLWAPPLLLGVLGMVAGIFPSYLEAHLLIPAQTGITSVESTAHLHLWSGFDPVFWMSFFTVLGGVGLYLLFRPSHRYSNQLKSLEKISSRYLLEQIIRGTKNFFYFITHLLQNGYLRYYTAVILTFLIFLIGLRMNLGFVSDHQMSFPVDFTFNEIATVAIMVISIFLAVFTSSRIVAVASLGGVGMCICLLFVYYSAPDLAMTQFTIDTLTVVLFVLLLKKLPTYLTKVDTGLNWRDLVISCTFGAMISVIAMEILLTGSVVEGISSYYAENAYQLAKGKNVVNVILVDFRGVDTLIEITVLAVAGLGVFSLIRLHMSVDS